MGVRDVTHGLPSAKSGIPNNELRNRTGVTRKVFIEEVVFELPF